MNVNRSLMLGTVVLAVLLLTLLASTLLGRTAAQRTAIGKLNELGVAATRRGVGAGCCPSFSFDGGGPSGVEDLTGRAYFGQVTDVWFRVFDDQQIIESIPSLRQLNSLSRIGFDKPPTPEVTGLLRDQLPTVNLVNKGGKTLP